MKKVLVAIFAVSLVAMAAFQIPMQNDSTLEESLKEDLQDRSIGEIKQPDMRVLDFDSESE